MRSLHRNKLLLGLLLLAVAGFAFLSAGGEFLHSHIHEHADEASSHECLFYQLATQSAVMGQSVIVACVFKAIPTYFSPSTEVVLHIPYFTPQLRAPPELA